jgi:hypothetical protein
MIGKKFLARHAKHVRTNNLVFYQSGTLLLITTYHFYLFAVLQATSRQCAMWILRVVDLKK